MFEAICAGSLMIVILRLNLLSRFRRAPLLSPFKGILEPIAFPAGMLMEALSSSQSIVSNWRPSKSVLAP
jgi:hypothetical protein